MFELLNKNDRLKRHSNKMGNKAYVALILQAAKVAQKE